MVHINSNYSFVTYEEWRMLENVDFCVLASRNRRGDNIYLKMSHWDLDFRLYNQEWNWKVLNFFQLERFKIVSGRANNLIFQQIPLASMSSSLSQRELVKVYFPTFNTSKMSGFESKSKILIATTTGFAGTVKRDISTLSAELHDPI